jgi:hypothetical protein
MGRGLGRQGRRDSGAWHGVAWAAERRRADALGCHYDRRFFLCSAGRESESKSNSRSAVWHGAAAAGRAALEWRPSYLFGTNDTLSWNLANNVDTMPQIQQAMKAAHLTLIRTFFFEHSLYDGHATTDAEIDQRLATIQNSGMVCMGELATKNSMAWDEHVVKYAGNRCLLYEFMNEPDYEGYRANGYLKAWNSEIPRLRAINPHALFGGPATYTAQGNFWRYTPTSTSCFMEDVLRGAGASGVYPDFVTFHWYPCYHDNESGRLAKAATYGDEVQEVRGWVRSDLGRSVPVGITEWNFDPGSPPPASDDKTSFIRSFTTQALHAMAQAGLSFACQFDAANAGGYGHLDMFDIANGGAAKSQMLAMAAYSKSIYPGGAP